MSKVATRESIEIKQVTPPRVSVGRVAWGLVLIFAGVIWLLDATGLAEFELRLLLPLALMGVGLLIVATSRRSSTAALMALGLLITVWLTALPPSSFDEAQIIDGAVGDRFVQPLSVDELESYSLGAGNLVIDLSKLDLTREIDVSAGVGVGNLEVLVPPGVDFTVQAHSGAGEVRVLGGRVQSGMGVDVDYESRDFPEEAVLLLHLRVGFGIITVARG